MVVRRLLPDGGWRWKPQRKPFENPTATRRECPPGSRSRTQGWQSRPCASANRNRASRRVGAFLTAGLEQEPGAPLGLVDEQFEQLGGARVLIVIGQLVRFAHRRRH